MNNKTKYIAGLAGMTASSLHAQVVYQQNVYSILQASTTSAQTQTTPIAIDANNSFDLNQNSGYAGKSGTAAVQGSAQVSGIVGFSVDSNTESPGSTVSAADSFAGTIPEISGGGAYYYGLEMTEPTGTTPLFGWLEIDDTQSTPGDQIDTVSIGYDPSGNSVVVGEGAVPEPSTVGLMATAALLAGSSLIWKRRQNRLVA